MGRDEEGVGVRGDEIRFCLLGLMLRSEKVIHHRVHRDFKGNFSVYFAKHAKRLCALW